MIRCNRTVTLLSSWVIMISFYGLLVIATKKEKISTLNVTGKPVLVEEEVFIDKHQKFKVSGADKAILTKQEVDEVTEEATKTFTTVHPEKIDSKTKKKVDTKKTPKPSLAPIIMQPVHPEKDKQHPKVGEITTNNTIGEKEVVLARYRVVIPIIIPRVLLPAKARLASDGLRDTASRNSQKIDYVESKYTKNVRMKTNATHIDEIYQPELVNQKIIRDYVVRDPRTKSERVVRTEVRNVTEGPVKLNYI